MLFTKNNSLIVSSSIEKCYFKLYNVGIYILLDGLPSFTKKKKVIQITPKK